MNTNGPLYDASGSVQHSKCFHGLRGCLGAAALQAPPPRGHVWRSHRSSAVVTSHRASNEYKRERNVEPLRFFLIYFSPPIRVPHLEIDQRAERDSYPLFLTQSRACLFPDSPSPMTPSPSARSRLTRSRETRRATAPTRTPQPIRRIRNWRALQRQTGH